LADTLLTSFPRVRRTLVFGTTKDKDMEAQLRSLIPLFDVIVATRYIENARAIPPEDVAATVFELSGRTALLTNDPAEALEAARRATAPEGLICVTGSLFLAAESRAILLPHVRRRSITEVVT
jgi:dihydrofolate synthase/folylpolyglutamate synthase